MPHKRHGAGGLAISTIAAYLFLSVAWAAQPNDFYPRPNNVGQRSPAAHRESLRERGPRGPGEVRDLQNHNEKEKHLNTNDGDFELETLSASQTFAPARQEDFGGVAVRAPVPAAAIPSALIQDRSLQDWVMEDLILLATVDGSIHARDRKTGHHRWALSAENYPMVETTYNRTGAADDLLNKIYWIVEPSNDGDIYLFYTGEGASGNALQKLNMNVKKLVSQSPYSVDTPHVIYTADKSTSLYSFDAKTGNVLAVYGGTGSTFEDKTTCHMHSPFEGDVETECKVEGTISIGRVTYNVLIQRPNGDRLCHIRYSEWIPNQRDRDLHMQYSASMDQSYVYTSYTGRVLSLKHEGASVSANRKGLWTQQLPNPVVKVFDVARPAQMELRDTELVLLPQPVGPMGEVSLTPEKLDFSRVYINQTKPESFYALSESAYPSVTHGAKDAQCYNTPWIESLTTTGHKLTPYELTQSMLGVHQLAAYRKDGQRPKMPSEERLTIDGRTETEVENNTTTTVSTDVPAPPSSSVISNSYIVSSFAKNPIDITVLLLIGIFTFLYATGRINFEVPRRSIQLTSDVPEVTVSTADPVTLDVGPVAGPPELPKDEAEQALEHDAIVSTVETTSKEAETVEKQNDAATVEVDVEEPVLARSQTLSTTEGNRSRSNSVANDQQKAPRIRIVEPEISRDSEEPENADDALSEKKKARRGQRGGKSHRRKKKPNKADAGADDNVDLAVEKAMENAQQHEPMEVQPDPPTTQTVGNPMRVGDNALRIGNLTVFEDKILGYGSHGTRVFKGTFGGRDVAVKVMLKEFYDVASQEVNLLQESDDHRNVVRYYDKETAGGFLYIALELCPATLAEVIERQFDYLSLVGMNGLDRVDALRQITRGIRYLHSLKIVHRDIKPENILVAAGKKRLTQPDVIQPPRMLISDFGLCKKLDVDQSSFRATTAHAAGTSGWRAPELLMDDDNVDNTKAPSNSGTNYSTNSEPVVLDTATNRRATRAIDIFALGCIFFYVLSGGNHPFDGSARGEGRYFREVNIIKGRHDLSDLSILGDYRGEAEDLISRMITREPKQRPDAGQILAHPFFWSPTKRLEFLCHVSDQFEFEPRDPPSYELQILESIAPVVLKEAGGDFMSKLPQSFLATLAKQRKYQGGRMLDVLRALRNKKNHYEDMPPNVKAMVGGLPEGYLLFWTTRFPLLLMGCHQVVKDCGWHIKDRFKEYYEPPTED